MPEDVLSEKEVEKSFRIHGDMRQGCVMSLWLFNLLMDGAKRNESNGW